MFPEIYLEYKLYLPVPGAGHSYLWCHFQLCVTPTWLRLMARDLKLRQTGLPLLPLLPFYESLGYLPVNLK